jgi:hypothetical protein
MSTEEDIVCTRCNGKTDQILMAFCEHNLCLSCAAIILKKQQITGENGNQYLKCEKCYNMTELDPETINQILDHENEVKKNDNNNLIDNNFENNDVLEYVKNNNKYIPNRSNNNLSKKNYTENSATELNIISDLNNNNFINVCKEHGEKLNYLCLDCMTNCVCPECVVHGIHRNHEVLNIKKAYPLIYNKLEELSKFVNGQSKQLSLTNGTILKKKNLISVIIERFTNEIHNIFEQIKIRLENKEKDILNQTINSFNKTINNLNNYENLIKTKIADFENLIQQINHTLMQKDQFYTINYFCENKNKIMEQIELKNFNLPNLEKFANIKFGPNKDSMNRLINDINNFGFVVQNINKIKGNLSNRNINKAQQNQQINLENKNNMSNINQNHQILNINNQIFQNNQNQRPKSSKVRSQKKVDQNDLFIDIQNIGSNQQYGLNDVNNNINQY